MKDALQYQLKNAYRVVGGIAYLSTSKGEFMVDAEDLHKLAGFNKWHITKRGDVCAQKMSRKVICTVKLHRLIMGIVDPKIEVDHKNHDRKDNRKVNLRPCHHIDNGRNLPLRKGSRSGVSGVIWDKQTSNWNANIVVNRKKLNLGRYNDFLEAVSARLSGEAIYYGEFAPNA